MNIQRFRRRNAAYSFILLSALTVPIATAEEVGAPVMDRPAIEKIVRDYLMSNPEILDEVSAELEKRKEALRLNAQAKALETNAKELTNSTSDFVVGNPNGDITLVEFFDFNCGYCKKALADVSELAKSDKNLRIVLKDFPILSEGSASAARVALAAKVQLPAGKLFEFHSKILELTGMIDGERAIGVASEMGLDVKKIRLDMQGMAVNDALASNMKIAQDLGLTGTPSFVVGKEVIQGAVGYQSLKEAVETGRRCRTDASC